MPILNYTTKVDALKTMGEISKMLSKGGASKIINDYDEEQNLSAISFVILEGGVPILFNLPCNWEGVLKTMEQQKVAVGFRNKKHAINVAWRIVKDWVEAQLAMVEAKQATLATLFLTWSVTDTGETLGQRVLGNGAKGLKLLSQ